MQVEKGSIYGLVGPNGAGKSTILRHITGVYRPDSGSILVDGQPVYENPAVKQRIFSIPDELFYFTSATTRDMMKFYRGIYPRFDLNRYQALRDAFPTVNERHPIRRLSKGMQKQSAFWLALCCQPDLLVLDEPVDGLDPVMRRQVWSLIMSDVANRGTTVLISSHNLRELEDICDHVGIMNQGKMLLERSLADMQGSTHKVQLVGDLPEGLEVLHETAAGRMRTLIIRGDPEQLQQSLAAAQPTYFDILPLSLEEIFIYELGGVNDEVKNILL
jgi:ABC-2 type transport system ATP-binding protein